MMIVVWVSVMQVNSETENRTLDFIQISDQSIESGEL